MTHFAHYKYSLHYNNNFIKKTESDYYDHKLYEKKNSNVGCHLKPATNIITIEINAD